MQLRLRAQIDDLLTDVLRRSGRTVQEEQLRRLVAVVDGAVVGALSEVDPDPREMAKSDCVVIWGTNAVSTQVNVMTHAVRARKERGAKIVAIDVYMNGTMLQADLPILVRPGTDGALACAVMTNPPAWLDRAAREMRREHLEAQIAGLQSQLEGAR